MDLLQEIKVEKVIIGKQFEISENYKEFLEIAKKKKIKIDIVEEGTRINIDRFIYFDVLWPSKSQEIQKNSINNNALVCKMNYEKFAMLFTGDIEEEAQKILISKYKDTNVLKSTILKVRTPWLKNFFKSRIFKSSKTQNCIDWSWRK